MSETVFVMNREGVGMAVDADVVRTEQWRIDTVRALGRVPEEVGDKVVEAPARGAVRVVEGFEVGLTETGGLRRMRSGHMGRKTLHRADTFDVMAAKASGHGKPSPFTPSQIAMGRLYRDLVERHESVGVKCSAIFGETHGGSGDGGGFMDALVSEGERIDQIRRRIGNGSAMVVRRARPSTRGSRSNITDRRLVDMVCLEDASMSSVLRAHGWTINAGFVGSLNVALARALERMMGPVQRGCTTVVRIFDDACPDV